MFLGVKMKVMTVRDVKNHFGEFLDSVQREPVIVTKNNRPVGVMISIHDATDTVLSELIDKEDGYDAWLLEKITHTMNRVTGGNGILIEHTDAMEQLQRRLKAKTSTATL
jgi:prevent-host-death family protein